MSLLLQQVELVCCNMLQVKWRCWLLLLQERR
jgi:hypothetical protein